jgi:hypothetical protein
VTSRAWTSAGLSVVATWGFIAGLVIGSAAMLIMALLAFGVLLWLGLSDPRRRLDPSAEFRYERDRERIGL